MKTFKTNPYFLVFMLAIFSLVSCNLPFMSEKEVLFEPASSNKNTMKGVFVANIIPSNVASIFENNLVISKNNADLKTSFSFSLPGKNIGYLYQGSTGMVNDKLTYVNVIITLSSNDNNTFLSCFAHKYPNEEIKDYFKCTFKVNTVCQKLLGCIMDRVNYDLLFLVSSEDNIFAYNQNGKLVDKQAYRAGSSFKVINLQGIDAIIGCDTSTLFTIYIENGKLVRHDIFKLDDGNYKIPSDTINGELDIGTIYLSLLNKNDLYFFDYETNSLSKAYKQFDTFNQVCGHVIVIDGSLYEYVSGKLRLIIRKCSKVINFIGGSYRTDIIYKGSDDKIHYYLGNIDRDEIKNAILNKVDTQTVFNAYIDNLYAGIPNNILLVYDKNNVYEYLISELLK